MPQVETAAKVPRMEAAAEVPQAEAAAEMKQPKAAAGDAGQGGPRGPQTRMAGGGPCSLCQTYYKKCLACLGGQGHRLQGEPFGCNPSSGACPARRCGHPQFQIFLPLCSYI